MRNPEYGYLPLVAVLRCSYFANMGHEFPYIFVSYDHSVDEFFVTFHASYPIDEQKKENGIHTVGGTVVAAADLHAMRISSYPARIIWSAYENTTEDLINLIGDIAEVRDGSCH